MRDPPSKWLQVILDIWPYNSAKLKAGIKKNIFVVVLTHSLAAWLKNMKYIVKGLCKMTSSKTDKRIIEYDITFPAF